MIDDFVKEITNLRCENSSLKYKIEKSKKQLKTDYYVKGLEGTIKEYQQAMDKYANQQKEFIKYLQEEKDRLTRECSNIYEDSLGKTRLVNEDVFNEVGKILNRYKEIIGLNNE